MTRRTVTLLVSVLVALFAYAAQASAQSLVGDVSLEPSTITVTAGTPQAYPFTADYTGTVTGLDLYVATGSTSTLDRVGLYADSSGAPGALMAHCAHTGTTGWISCTAVPSTATVTAGKQYWLAESGDNGVFKVRGVSSGGNCTGQVSGDSGITELEDPWTAGSTTSSCPISAYATGTASAGDPVLLGDTGNAPDAAGVGGGAPQSPEAYAYTATTAGTAQSISVYFCGTGCGVGSPAAYSTEVGLYSDNSGVPGTLLGSGTITSPTLDAWNTVNISGSASISAGAQYWIATLNEGTGTQYEYFTYDDLANSDGQADGCTQADSGNTTYPTSYSSLQSPWASSHVTQSCGLVAVVNGATSTLINGASTAACSPSACGAVSNTDVTLTGVSNDCGGTGVPACPGSWTATQNRAFRVYRPSNLPDYIAGSKNLVPAILVFGGANGCGANGPGQWNSMAPSNKFEVVEMEYPCSGRPVTTQWGKKWAEGSTDFGVGSCSVNNVSTLCSEPDDEPYVLSVIRDITNCPSGATSSEFCADPQRIYVAGQSSGSSMALDAMCDPSSSSLIRGGQADSGTFQTGKIDESNLTINGDYPTAQPNCPAVGSTGNQHLFIQSATSEYGIDTGLWNDSLSSHHMQPSEMEQWAANAMGCQASNVTNSSYGPTPTGFNTQNVLYSNVGPCAFEQTGTNSFGAEALGITSGTHTWNCQDSNAGATGGCGDAGTAGSTTDPPPPHGFNTGAIPFTDGVSVEQEFWNYVANGESF